MKLLQAVKEYKKEKRVSVNSYQWYRKYAKDNGYITIADVKVPTFKKNGIWHVDENAFAMALEKHRKLIAELKKITDDYAKGIIHGKNGDTILTEWGGYKIHGPFRFVWNSYEILRKESDGTWYCNKCNIPAETEHEKEKCHLCSDWNGCGRDCTLSRVYCKKCNASLNI